MNDATYPPLWREHDAKIRPYRRWHKAIGWTQTLVSLLWMVAWFRLGIASALDQIPLESRYLRWLVYFAVLGVSFEFWSLPFSIASQQVERRFGLSKQSWPSWWGDRIKALAVGTVLGAIVISLIFGCVSFAGAYWWVGAAIGFVLLSVILAQLAPVILLPLFIKLDPLPDGEVRSRILAMCQKHGVKIGEIYRLGLGAKTEKGNAAFMGLGRTKRIAIGDTILDKFTTEEVEAVFAHELGHQLHGDIWRGLALSTVLLLASFAISAPIAADWIDPWLGVGFGTASSIAIFAIVLGIVQIPVGIIQALHSRSRENAADVFAAKQPGLARPLGDALERLTLQNWGLFKPLPLIEFLTYSHPSPRRRINALRTIL